MGKNKRKKSFGFYLGKRYDGIMGRCYRKSDASYRNYGAKGIKVCSEWIEDIENFKEWFTLELSKNSVSVEDFMENTRSYQIDRITSTDHYTPENCRIVTPQQNTRNRGVKKREIESAEGKKYYIST
jgi:hypothetical protein